MCNNEHDVIDLKATLEPLYELRSRTKNFFIVIVTNNRFITLLSHIHKAPSGVEIREVFVIVSV